MLYTSSASSVTPRCTPPGLRLPLARPRPWESASHLIFFFQAEDGIRDLIVTGVQTCALPICLLDPLGSKLDPSGSSKRPRQECVYGLDGCRRAVKRRPHRDGCSSSVPAARSQDRKSVV